MWFQVLGVSFRDSMILLWLVAVKKNLFAVTVVHKDLCTFILVPRGLHSRSCPQGPSWSHRCPSRLPWACNRHSCNHSAMSVTFKPQDVQRSQLSMGPHNCLIIRCYLLKKSIQMYYISANWCFQRNLYSDLERAHTYKHCCIQIRYCQFGRNLTVQINTLIQCIWTIETYVIRLSIRIVKMDDVLIYRLCYINLDCINGWRSNGPPMLR